jgi:hypothetical protein
MVAMDVTSDFMTSLMACYGNISMSFTEIYVMNLSFSMLIDFVSSLVWLCQALSLIFPSLSSQFTCFLPIAMPQEHGISREGLDYYRYLANRNFLMNDSGPSSPLTSSFVEMPSMDIVQVEEEWGHVIIE